MDKSSLSLEQVLVSYNFMILFLIVFIVLVSILISTNMKGFNKLFGYEIFVTGPILLVVAYLIREIFHFKQSPSTSWLSGFAQSSQPWFLSAVSLLVALLGILGLIIMLYVGGIFSDRPPENNTAMILNFVVITLFIVIATVIYTSYQQKDNDTLNKLPYALQNVFHLRSKYTFLFIVFIALISLLYFVNPWGIMTKYGGPILFFTIFIGIVIVIMITIYQYFLANASQIDALKNMPGPFAFIIKALYVLSALGISYGLIYGLLVLLGVFNQDSTNTNNWGHWILNIFLFSAMLGIIYKLANAGGFLDKNPYYRLILNTLLYIPCLLVTITNYLSQLFGFIKSKEGAFAPPKPLEIKILVFSLCLLSSYFFWIFLGKHWIQSTYLKQGGRQLVNQPIQTNTLSNIITYQVLSGGDRFNYQYAISFWFYLDAFSPTTHNKEVSLLSYGENPTVKYCAENNTLYVTVKPSSDKDLKRSNNGENSINETNINAWKDTKLEKLTDAIEMVKSISFGNEHDSNGHPIIYKHPDVQLQKWNHMVLNYNGGTLDVFYNGILVKSAIEVVPYLKFDMLTVGAENGISGNIANVMYFKQPLDYLTVNTLYASLKTNNPPVIPDNNQKIIPL
jgi:hypothetical protein